MAISSPGRQGTPAYKDEGFEGSDDSRGSGEWGRLSVLSAIGKEIILHPKTSICSIPLGKANEPQAGSCQSKDWKNRHLLFVFICLFIPAFI